jgi:hypothetical protein
MVIGLIPLILIILLVLWLTGYARPYAIGPLGIILVILIILWLAGAFSGSCSGPNC